MQLKTITAVSTEPVTLSEVKAHLRVDSILDDTLITSLITVAREYIENFTKRALATQTLELILDSFPNAEYIDLPLSPLQSVTSVKYKDSSGNETTLGSSGYIVNTDFLPGKIILAYGCSWPTFTPYPTGAIRIKYVAGHETNNPVPISIKQAMLLLIGHLYENREATNIKELKEVPFAVNALLYPYKILGWC